MIERDPFAVLGPHIERDAAGRAAAVVVRSRQPAAIRVAVRLLPSGELRPMRKVDSDGLYEWRMERDSSTGSGLLRVTSSGEAASTSAHASADRSGERTAAP